MASSLRRVSILGCGWLGLALGRHLAKAGLAVRGSTTTPEKQDALRRSGIEPFLLRLTPELECAEPAAFFDTDALVLNIPPPRGVADRRDHHLRQIRAVQQAATDRVPWILFASSTGVYPDVEREVAEDDVPPGDLDALGGDRRRATGDLLLDAEAQLWTDDAFETTVVRLGGLYGAERHPGRFLAGRTDIARPQAPVNLIHQEDCVGLIDTILHAGATGRVVNAVADAHPTREAIYTRAAEALGLDPPTFDGTDTRRGKTVLNRVATGDLGYTFQHPDPMDDLADLDAS